MTKTHYLLVEENKTTVAVVTMAKDDASTLYEACEAAITDHEVEAVTVRSVEILVDGSGKVQAKLQESDVKKTYYLTEVQIY